MMVSNRRQIKESDTLEDARQRLIDAGLLIFSQHNYEGATTRRIAEKAGVNLASIPYYFGGKEGLYRATIESMVEQFQTQMMPQVQALRQRIEQAQPSRAQSVDYLCQFLSQLISSIIALNAPRNWLRLGFSDDQAPIRAFDVIYEGIICPIHDAVGELVARCLEIQPRSPEAILRTHALVGQVIAFHLSREAVLKRLNQSELSPADIRLIQVIIEDHVRAIFAGSSPARGVSG
jgi:AcrR family transcriptional regulator